MATSGTDTFLMSRDDLIASALRTMEVIGSGETPSPDDLTNCGQALNILCKAYANLQNPLWCAQELVVPMVAGQASYLLGPAGTPPSVRPVRILQAFLRRSDNTDVPVAVVSRMEWFDQATKSQASQPVQLFYDAQLTNGIMTTYGVSPDSTSSMHLLIQRMVQDINLAAQNPDFPQEAFQMLKWKLVDELGLEYGAKMHVLQIAAQKAQLYESIFSSSNQEEVSHYFLPSGRRN